ncbi:hypothetical protein [Hydrocarboniphaga sp.]|uniref:hypothetical protein n=1 Tax=Hydrocarboniphaga sp. TaxID=2033016 RepID=UPI0026066D94|nr:hypothetical protein [Hydrocarboniphaga sp.]
MLALLLTACGGGGGDKNGDADSGSYTTGAGKVYAPGGEAVQPGGINMFGFDSAILIPHSTWTR